MPTDEIQLAVVNTRLDQVVSSQIDIRSDMRDLKETMGSSYVTQDQFRPVKLFVYGFIGLALATLGTFLISAILPRLGR
jgi:hypothetical protein